MRSAIFVAALTSALCACSQKPAEPSPKEYSLHGEVVKVDSSGQLATIKGDKIEGWMEAMTMEYPVKDKQEFQKLKPGDKVDAKVMVRGTNYWLSGINEAPAQK